MTISLARLEDVSLQQWIKGTILPLKWVEKVVNAPLTYNSTDGVFRGEVIWTPNFLDEGRGWVYFDPAGTMECVSNSIPTTEQTTRIEVRNEFGATIPQNLYTIDYINGTIKASGGTTTVSGVPTTIDYTQYYVSLIDSWPGVNPPEVPIISVDVRPVAKEPFQIGPGRIARRRGTFHIFATSSAERDDLTEFMYDALYLRHIPVLDFRQGGEPLNYDGTFNQDFTGNLLKLDNNDDALLYFENVRADYITPRSDWTDINRFRSRVDFEMISYRNSSSDFNVL